jgi:copper chaperone NosL
MNKLTSIIISLPLFIFLTSCVASEVKPRDPLWEKDSCAHCRMILSEKRYAVQRILSNGEVHYYDDIGCAMKHPHSHDDGKLYVRPDGGNDWIPAQEATYQSGLSTPMNSGFGAVKSGGSVNYKDILKKYEIQ